MALALATHTPVPYWLSLPVVELGDWVDDVAAAMKARG